MLSLNGQMEDYPTPRALSKEEIPVIIDDFRWGCCPAAASHSEPCLICSRGREIPGIAADFRWAAVMLRFTPWLRRWPPEKAGGSGFIAGSQVHCCAGGLRIAVSAWLLRTLHSLKGAAHVQHGTPEPLCGAPPCRKAARNAKQAGFDGVEVHGANGGWCTAGTGLCCAGAADAPARQGAAAVVAAATCSATQRASLGPLSCNGWLCLCCLLSSLQAT